jgi:hypothetical protein
MGSPVENFFSADGHGSRQFPGKNRDCAVTNLRVGLLAEPRAFRRWCQIGRPIAFYHRKVYERAFPLIDEAVSSMTPAHTGIGIDVQGLREEFGPSAQALDLRLASIFIAIQQAALCHTSFEHVA